jgi:hypothetical protein
MTCPGYCCQGERRHDPAGERGMPASVSGFCGSRFEQAPQSFPWCVPANDGGCLWPRHGAGIQQGTHPGGHRGIGRVKLSTTITEPANPASSSERWESSFPASSARRWGSASSAPTTGLRRKTNPATTAGQHGSTCATAEPVPAHVREIAFGSPGPRSPPATGLLRQATGYRGTYTAEATTRWETTEPSTLSRI